MLLMIYFKQIYDGGILIIIINLIMPHSQIRNVKGGGVHYVTNWKTPQSKLFKAGLRHYKNREVHLVQGKILSNNDYHDKISYERGAVIHSRSYSNQWFNFHYMFGGFRKYVIQRWWINHFYRKTLRLTWIPFLVAYGIGCYGMRKYDTAAYNFFYFSD